MALNKPGFHEAPQIVTNVLRAYISKLVRIVEQREFQKIINVPESDCKIKKKTSIELDIFVVSIQRIFIVQMVFENFSDRKTVIRQFPLHVKKALNLTIVILQ